jgi:hypothetical protein
MERTPQRLLILILNLANSGKTLQLPRKIQREHKMFDMLKDNLTYAVQTLHRDVCRDHKSRLEKSRALAEGGQPGVAVRALLGDPRYRATLAGDTFAVYKCEEIKEYQLKHHINNCTTEWLATYYYKRQIQTGWVQLSVHNHSSEPPKCFIFKINQVPQKEYSLAIKLDLSLVFQLGGFSLLEYKHFILQHTAK